MYRAVGTVVDDPRTMKLTLMCPLSPKQLIGKEIMSPMTDNEYVNLDRTFHELSVDACESNDVDIIRAAGTGDRLFWSDLIKEYRVVILSEAGSGKTAEIRNVTSVLRKQGKPAFFLRLEHIPKDFEAAFELGTYEDFKEWLATGDEGWLLLDSVDEARLRSPGDFELAICKLSREIRTAKDRAHIVITGRITAWRPMTDLRNCTRDLPYTFSATSERSQSNEDDTPDDSVQTETVDRPPPSFRIVALDDLTAEQVLLFVKARGIENSRTFIDAIDRADAGSFTSRPQDLEELTEFWAAEGRIGSRLELMQKSIERRLSERDQNRADAHPLSKERARDGAILLAAATTLTQEPSIRVPDGANNSKGIAVGTVLPDWDERNQATLLSRPIFDEALYGTVRFHHRSVREYLTAQWFAELLKRETSRREITRLFFREQYGWECANPALRPILPWLAILDEKIRECISRIAPEILLEGGDPSQLPLAVRKSTLHEVCEKMAKGIANQDR